VDPDLFTFRKNKNEYLLYFGRIHLEKGLHTAIEIAEKSGFPLKIAGLIQDEHYFKTEIEEKIDGVQIQYLGNLGKEERDVILGGAKALLHPISFEEPFGLSVLEAMMCGTPVIAFSRGSMPELIVHGVTGFLVKNVPEAVLAVQKLDEISPENCRSHAETNFSIDKMIDSYIEAYKTVVENF
jgi:glycosyltransferase involved in cell wall biosynthesis